MEAPRILAILKRRKGTLENSSTLTDTSEVLVKRAEMTRMLINEYADILGEIEGAEKAGSLTERRAVHRP